MEDPERSEPRPMTPFTLIGWTLGLWFFTQASYALLAQLRPDESDFVTPYGCQAAVYLLGLFAILRVHAPEASIRRFVAFRPTQPLFYPLAAFLGVTAFGFAYAIFEVLERYFPTPDEGKLSDLIAQAPAPQKLLAFSLIALLGPALEEIIFRGAFVRALKNTSPRWLVVVVTAGAFGLVHTEWQRFIPIFMVGVVMAWLRLASGSILPSFILHAAFNAVQFVLVLRSHEHGDEPNLTLPLFVLGAVGTAILLAISRPLARTESAEIARQEDDLA